MRKVSPILISCTLLLFIVGTLQSQSKYSKTGINWISNGFMPGNILAFEENKGQFPKSAKGWNILYGCTIPGIDIYFTDKGIIYNLSKISKPETIAGEGDDKPLKNEKIIYQHLFIGFTGCSGSVRLEAEDKTPWYFNEGMPGDAKRTVTDIKGFRKIVYHDLYPGIDVIYTIHDKKGIEYAVKVKPGADAALFKMHYEGETGLSIDKSGNLHIGTLLGDIIDHAPSTFLHDLTGAKIASSFKMPAENEISFRLGHNTGKGELVIDPWTTFPVTPATYACDVSSDANNNTYCLEYSVQSIYTDVILMYLQKYNPVGILQWTYTFHEYTTTPFNPIEADSSRCNPLLFSDFVTYPDSNSYIAAPYGFSNLYEDTTYGMISINSSGKRNYLYYTYKADSIYETWNVANFCADYTLVEAGCYKCCNTTNFDGVNAATGVPNSSEYTNINIAEIYAGTVAPNGNYYALTATPLAADDALLCCTVTSHSAVLNWQVETTYNYKDASLKESQSQVGSNSIAAGCRFLYTSDGVNLDQRNLDSGRVLRSITIPGGSNMLRNVNSGIAVDPVCGNVYVGSNGTVFAYDFNLNSIGSFGGLPGRVFDVKCNNGLVTACGENMSDTTGFIVQMNAIRCDSGIYITSSNTPCGSNEGSATVVPTVCVGPYYYSWSNGQTTQSATGLSAGIYKVTVTPNNTCFTITDSVHIYVIPPYPTIKAIPDTICANDSTMLIAGGSGTYRWNNGQTNATIWMHSDTTFTVTLVVTEDTCIDSTKKVVTVIPLGKTKLKAVPGDTICAGQSVTLTASGGTIYDWSNGNTTSSITVSPSATQTYKVISTVTCTTDTLIDTIHVINITPVISGTTQGCKGFGDTLTISGGTSYLWNTGSTTTQNFFTNITKDSTVSVEVFLGKCSKETSVTLTLKAPPNIYIKPDTVCAGGCVTLHAVTGVNTDKYLWSNGAITDTTTVCPDIPTQYSVTVSNGCPSMDSTLVQTANQLVNACCDETITLGDSAAIFANHADRYFWLPDSGLNCYTCPTVVASPETTTTYTVTGVDSNGCISDKTITITLTCGDFIVPNVFTPNGDGINDFFTIKTIDMLSWLIIIYDRWGREVFKSTNPYQYWNGNTPNGAKVSDGVYFYIIHATCSAKTIQKDGFVQVIR